MIYTVVPHNIIFGFENDVYSKLLEIEYLGEKIQVYLLQENEYVINRIVSTSPKAFLNPGLQPGTIIKINLGNKPEVMENISGNTF